MSGSEPQREGRPIEVAVIGGGCGAISAAFELSRPEHRGRYHVTVYQLGWRLGGKGASGRGPTHRIEEHGLHIWLGFYENAFRLLRECYEELGRDPREVRIADWRDAFYADPHVGVMEWPGGRTGTPDKGGRDKGGRDTDGSDSSDGSDNVWQPWIGFFTPLEGAPGDPLTDRNPFTLRAYLRRTAELLVNLLRSARRVETDATRDPREGGDGGLRVAAGDAARLARLGTAVVLAGAIHAAKLLADLLHTVPVPPAKHALRLLDTVSSGVRQWIEGRASRDDELRRVWEILDLVLAILAGVFRFGLLTDPRGLDALDDYECREWLRLNGASEASVNSAFVRGLYDLALAYEDGDVERPMLAAGQALRGAARMFFTYRGALFWKMRAGMGDVVFAPFYEVLKRRGVTFEFFHRLENVRLAGPEGLAPGESPHVEALEFDVQARVRGTYDPLIDVDGLPCWPAEPRWEQLQDGEGLRDEMRAEGTGFECFWNRRKVATRTLRVGRDFDFVVLGVGLGAVPHVARELVGRDRRWRDMVENVKTVASQAFQIWLREDVEALGWNGPPLTLAGFVQPFDTWADMGQLLAEEHWGRSPRSLAYFCSVLPDRPGERVTDPGYRDDPDHPRRRREEVRRNAVRFLDRDVRHLWPRAVRDGGRDGEMGFRWELLVDPSCSDTAAETPGTEDRFATQYWTANVNPSDRYVLCPPGSPKHRISPLDTTWDNLTVAGDWTYCGFNEGCVEAAVMSGRLAAHALSGRPRLEDIVGYDHP